MRSLSFDIGNKIKKSIIILFSKDGNKSNIICNVSKTLSEHPNINASKIIDIICSKIGGAGGGQKLYASALIPSNENIKDIINETVKNFL